MAVIPALKQALKQALISTVFTETAKANNLRPYPYVEYLLTEFPKLRDDNGEMDTDKLDVLMPWSKDLPAELHIPRR